LPQIESVFLVVVVCLLHVVSTVTWFPIVGVQDCQNQRGLISLKKLPKSVNTIVWFFNTPFGLLRNRFKLAYPRKSRINIYK